MKERNKLFEDKIVAEIDFLTNTMSKVVGDLEIRMSEIESEQRIVNNHYSNLENRVNYLEKKILK